MDDLLGNYYVVTSASAKDKATLIRSKYLVQKGSNPAHNDFRNNFVRHIANADWSKLFNTLKVVNFGYQSN